MSSTGSNPKEFPTSLLPHQVALVETFFGPAAKRVVRLCGDVGLGKSMALAALAARLQQERPTARTLLLVPAALRQQFVEILDRAGVHTLLVDRYRFREMLDSTTGSEIWPRGVIAVVSADFAKQPDVQDSLEAVTWDLVIADEAHWFRGLRAELLRRVGGSAGRVVLATLPDVETSDGFPAHETTVVEWRREQITDQDGKPLDTAPRPALHEVQYTATNAERKLAKTLDGLWQLLDASTTQQRLVGRFLRRTLCSSPAALEAGLQKFEAGYENDDAIRALLEAGDEGLSGDGPANQVDAAMVEKTGVIARRALEEIEALQKDSKLGAFSTLISQVSDEKKGHKRICVLTHYLGTLYYLAAEIEGCGGAYQLLHGGMSLEDRMNALTCFTDKAPILLATRAVMTEGVSLKEVTDLVLYDLPETSLAFREVLGRFDRIGRTDQLNIYVFSPSDGAEDLVSEPLGVLRSILGSETKVHPAK